MIAERLLAELGPDIVTVGQDIPERNRRDWSGLPPVLPLALVRPRTTDQVAAALRACHDTGTPVVPQGGLSGLCGGGHPVAGGVAISLERMNRVLSVDAAQATLTAEAGCMPGCCWRWTLARGGHARWVASSPPTLAAIRCCAMA